MEENVKNLWLSKIKSGKVAVIESHYAPNNTNCIWLKDGQMYVYGNTGWEPLGSGSGNGGGLIKLPVKFDTIEVIGGGDDPQSPILNATPTTGNTKANSTLYYCKQKVSGDLFGPTENGIVLDLAFYFGGGDNPKGGDTRAIKSGLDDIFHRYLSFQKGSLIEEMQDSQMMLTRLGLDNDSSAKILVSWVTKEFNDQVGLTVLSLIYKGSNYLYIVDMDNIGLGQFYNNPDFRGITIMEDQKLPIPGPRDEEMA